ncbi:MULTISPECIES: hypothetical protein [Mycobacteriaceae]|uniref:Uncharacterized protein n=1 Tax=Mycolicibacterium parafortuitum TaxID=39692 RepID=A0ACC6MP00_MYCPF|nr:MULTISPECIES: hypothetical protein [Mycobacteriaceae]MDZ5088602.1 hypothetical protein [Mycolicibacterium parafortuitum]GFM16313.1 uncharacterized protein PO1_contig-005-72 [Mycobacterium sp. PO1]GFM25815.1 uncharacterized protein PO2_contig-076-45 [Mycobacterium sp. PO2]
MSVTPTDLTGTERAVLIVLMAESRPVANPELAALGPALDKPGRDKLNALGLIESERVKGRYVHELTDRGWALCRDIVAAGPPPRSTGPAKTLYTVLGALGRYLQRSEVSLAELFWPAETSEAETPQDRTLEDRVRVAYARLAPRPGGWVRLAELRAALDDARGDVDTALTALSRAPGVSVIPEEDQKKLTPDDRAAAVLIGDRPKHLIAIEA